MATLFRTDLLSGFVISEMIVLMREGWVRAEMGARDLGGMVVVCWWLLRLKLKG